MNQLLINPVSAEEHQEIIVQMYKLLGEQIQSYHKHRKMGNNTSISVELAQDLMASVEYTINQVGGVYIHQNVEEALRLGQEILKSKFNKAKSMIELVSGTAPHWQTECRWGALRYLRHYLDHYDLFHFAHKGLDDLFYPILISLPEGIQGIDCCLFYLNILWIENQIMAAVPDDVLDQFWDKLPADTLNQCEHLLINGMGKALINASITSFIFEPDEYSQLIVALLGANQEKLKVSACLLCQWLNLDQENVQSYVMSVIPQMSMWIGNHVHSSNLANLFL